MESITNEALRQTLNAHFNSGLTISHLFSKKDENKIKLIENIIKATNFLVSDKKIPLTRRIWHIMNNQYSVPLCHECTNTVSWGDKLYKTFCSVRCASSSTSTKNKIKKTNLNKYGTPSYTSSDSFKTKTASTILQKYGTAHYTQSNDFKLKNNATTLEKYGTEHYTQSDDYIVKTNKTNQEKYGADWYMSTDAFKVKASATNIEKYGTVNPMQSYAVQQRVSATMLDRYGTEAFKSSAASAEKQKQYHYSQNTSHLSPHQWNMLHDKEWLTTEHVINKKPLNQIAKELECHASTVANYFNYHNIDTLYFNTSYAEIEIYDAIIERNPVLVVKRNARNVIAPYELDIYFPEHNLAIEYCGIYWHCELHMDRNYHKMKADLCREKGINLLTIFEDEWTENRELVLNHIHRKLKQTAEPSIYARQCSIRTVDKKTKQTFLNSNHIQGTSKSSVAIGLYYTETLVALMALSKHNDTYMLERYATSAMVVGGFTKLLKHFTKNYQYDNIVTFADLRWSNGELYKLSGFRLDGSIPPDYSYFDKGKRYHKFNYRHRGMKHKFQKYDETLSEHENCLNNNVYRIYDCGKLRFIYGDVK